MRLLFDQNISFRIIDKLPDVFADCKHVSQVELCNCEDSEIWKFALDEGYVIVTFDSDFYEISLINGCPPKIIWLRTGNLTTIDIVKLLVFHLETINEFLNNSDQSDTACLAIE